MKKSILIAIGCIATILSNAQTPTFKWAKSMSANTNSVNDEGTSVTTDRSGNVYSTGYFFQKLDFNPAGGVADTFFLSAPPDGSAQFGYVSKLDANGNFLWAKQISNTNFSILCNVWCTSIKTDNSGNVYVTGNYGGKVDFDPDETTENYLTDSATGGGAAAFILKLDADGNFVWARSMEPATDAWFWGTSGQGIVLDHEGNLYTSGLIAGKPGTVVDLAPGVDVYNLTMPGSDTSMVTQATYFLKLDAEGNIIWGKIVEGLIDFRFATGCSCVMNQSIGIDDANNLYTFLGMPPIFTTHTIDFNPGTGSGDVFNLDLTPNDMVVLKLDAAGNFGWAKKISSTKLLVPGAITCGVGGTCITGAFSGTVDFDPGTAEYNISDTSTDETDVDMFILKLDASGNFVWAKSVGTKDGPYSYAQDIGRGIQMDLAGNVYITGDFAFRADFNPSPAIADTAYLEGGDDMFILKLNSTGDFVWAVGTKSDLQTRGNAITLDDATESIYTTGGYQVTCDFDPGLAPGDTLNYTCSNNVMDIFIHKMSQCNSSLDTLYITQHGDTLVASTAATYQWYKDGAVIVGANTSSYYPTANGTYVLESTYHGETCARRAAFIVNSFTDGINEHTLTNTINIYPNPNNGQFEIALQLNTQDNYTLELTNALGQVLYHEELKNYIGAYHKQLDETKYGAGIYLFRVKSSKEQSVKKVISW